MGFSKYIQVGKIHFAESMMYFTDYFASSIFIGLIIFIFISLWKVIYADGTTLIEGYTIQMMIWYLVMTESIVISPGHVVEDIGNEIQSGDIAQKLNKPYNYLLFHYATSLGKTIPRFITIFIIGSLITFSLVGGMKFSLVSLPLILLTVTLALTLHFLMMASLGILAFWLEDAHSLHFIYSKLVFVLGGMLVPLEIFPHWLQKISVNLPFSFVAYHPAKMFVQFDWTTVAKTIFAQISWIIVFILITTVLYDVCIKKVSINGG
jgi:ABC-2 type transport system permease protein